MVETLQWGHPGQRAAVNLIFLGQLSKNPNESSRIFLINGQGVKLLQAFGCCFVLYGLYVCVIEELTYFMILYIYTILGFGFVTFDSSQPVEKTANIHFHQINGKTV